MNQTQIYSFIEIKDADELAQLKKSWLNSLTSPQDGMWAHFREQSTNWGIYLGDETIGYAAVNEDNLLLQFYLLPSYLSMGGSIFKTFIKDRNIQTGMVGTNNPIYLSQALEAQQSMDVHTLLFRDFQESKIEEKEGHFREAQIEDKGRIVDFCHYSMGAPKEWLEGYIGGLIERNEIFYLEQEDSIIGTCEVRNNLSSTNHADIGMVVSPDFRRQGYGSYLLNKAKTKALERGKHPICSCEKENIGSVKSIHKCGFVSLHQLLLVTFE